MSSRDLELQQLKKAKELALENQPEQNLPKVIDTTNSVILELWKSESPNLAPGSGPHLDTSLCKFFLDLLLDIINHPSISSHEKPLIASQYLDTLWAMMNNIVGNDNIICTGSDNGAITHANECLKLNILTFTRIYPMLFDLVAKTSNESNWKTMQSMKKKILSIWKSMTITNQPLDLNNDNKNIGIKLAIIKFISQIIITHSSSIDNKDINISMVSENHPVISNKNKLESEAKILLDVILNHLIEEPMMVSSVFIGIINCLSFVMRQRSQTTMKILNGVLKFNIDAKFQSDEMSTLNYRMCKRFVERCYRNFVQFGIKNQFIKNSGSNQYYNKLNKISQTLFVIGEETKSKGILNFDENSVSKKIPSSEREKIVSYRTRKSQQAAQAQIQAQNKSKIESSQVNNENDNENNNNNDSNNNGVDKNILSILDNLQNYTSSKSNITNFYNTLPKSSNDSYSGIYSLMNSDNSSSNQDLSSLPKDVLIELTTEALYKADTKKLISGLSIVASRYTDLMNSSNNKRKREENNINSIDHSDKKLKKESTNNDIGSDIEDDEGLKKPKSFIFEPKPMDNDTKLKLTKRIIDKLFKIKDEKGNITQDKNKNKNDTESSPLEQIKLLNWNNEESWYHILIRLATRGTRSSDVISNTIREELLSYVMNEMNDRVSIMIEWMNEEWYADKLFQDENETDNNDKYLIWSLRLLDELIPFLENKHRKIFIRLMSELPSLTQDHINKVKPILLDPGRSTLGFQTLKFLLMFRVPVKPMVKKLLEAIMEADSTLTEQCKTILDKFCKN